MSEVIPESTQLLPTYVNDNLIKKALVKAFDNSSITIQDYDIKLSSVNGENFCSNIYRVYVRFEYENGNAKTEIKEMSLILKDMVKEMVEAGSSEMTMYEKVLPQMESILTLGTGVEVKLKPICLLCERDISKEIYVLEDLNSLNYKIADRFRGLDELHAIVLMKNIAKFHAASMLYAEKFPAETAVHLLSATQLSSQGAANPVANAIAIGGMEHAVKVVQKWENFDEIVNKMIANIKRFNEKISSFVYPKDSKVNVINHGDLWLNNFLFRYDDYSNKPIDVAFVDFQNCFLGSPGYDINYFLNTSVQLQVLKAERYKLLRCYYKELQLILMQCGAKVIPTWQMIMEEVRNCEFVGYYAVVCELPICCMSTEAANGFKLATFTDPKAMVKKYELMYSNERVIETLRYSLDRFNELKVLD